MAYLGKYTIAAAPIFEAQSIARAFGRASPELEMPASSGFYSFGNLGATRRAGQGGLEEPADALRLTAGSGYSRECASCACAPPPRRLCRIEICIKLRWSRQSANSLEHGPGNGIRG
jgi:hypothetical protein